MQTQLKGNEFQSLQPFRLNYKLVLKQILKLIFKYNKIIHAS